MKKAAVIIPNYNGYRFAERCLKALEAQTFKDFEVCIIDDCSTDGSYEALKKYAEDSPADIRIIRAESNMGPGHARKLGINATDSEWIAFCDIDDWYDTDFFERMLNNAETSKADLVMCDHRYVFGDGSTAKAGVTDWAYRLPQVKENVLAYSKMSLCRLMGKRDLFRGITIPEIYYGEDAPVTIQLISNADNIYVDTDAHYNYLIREGSASSRINKRAVDDYIQAFEVIYKAIGTDYPNECEYIGINMILYGVTLIGEKANEPKKKLISCIRDFEKKYPAWESNIYLANLGKKKIIFLWAVRRRLMGLCSAYAGLHSYLIARKSQQ